MFVHMKSVVKINSPVEVSQSIYDIIQLLCKAIKERRLVRFPYESERRNALREIRPYMLIHRERKGNFELEEVLELVGLTTEQMESTQRQPGHYFLYKLDIKQIKVSNEIFHNPGVPREIVVHTKSPVVCRFMYDDEDPKEVMKSWIKITKKNKSSKK